MSTDIVLKKHNGGKNKGQPKYKLPAAPSLIRNLERRMRRFMEKRGVMEKDPATGVVTRRDMLPEERDCLTADPLEILVSVASGLDPLHPGDYVDLETRIEAAKAAAQYTRPKITELTGAEGAPLNGPVVFDMSEVIKLPVAIRRQMEDLQLAMIASKRLEAGDTLKVTQPADVVGVEFLKE